MKRTALKRRTPLRAKTRIKGRGSSDTSKLKQEIQGLVRAVVIERDGGCIFGKMTTYFDSVRTLGLNPLHVPPCNGYDKNGNLILQADHLIERSNSATYADTRLIVCVCKGHHGWKHFKKSNHDQYDRLVKKLIHPRRTALWELCEGDSWRPTRTSAIDWRLTVAALRQELRNTGAAPNRSRS